MRKGDIVLIPFQFTDLSGNKIRPAVVLVESEYDVTLCFISTQLKWKETSDIELSPSVENGLKKNSLIRLSKIATLDKELAKAKLGELQTSEIIELNIKLKHLLQLN